MDKRGQAAAIGVCITLIVTLLVGIIVLNAFIPATSPVGKTTYATPQTTNSSFVSNASGWDNSVQDNAVNAWNSGGYVTTTTTDNDAVKDNGIWNQSVTVGSFDTVTSATTSFKYRVIDNAGQSSIVVKALLGSTVLYSATITENSASWTSVDNNVASLITATGTYTFYLRAELLGTGTGVNLQVGFDDASLTVQTSLTTVDPTALAAYNNTKMYAWVGIGLMALAIIILAAVSILAIVRGGLATGGNI